CAGAVDGAHDLVQVNVAAAIGGRVDGHRGVAYLQAQRAGAVSLAGADVGRDHGSAGVGTEDGIIAGAGDLDGIGRAAVLGSNHQ
ncbi:hypothetical protein ABTK21_19920, partial [Acinetobacter baumannii]